MAGYGFRSFFMLKNKTITIVIHFSGQAYIGVLYLYQQQGGAKVENDKYKQINVRILESVDYRASVLAAIQKLDKREVVERALIEYCNKQEGEEKE